MDVANVKICVVGLGYVGLPLAVAFGNRFSTIGYDIQKDRIESLKEGIDTYLAHSSETLASAGMLSFTFDVADLKDANVYIVTVPTPVDKYNNPDLAPLISATKIVASVLAAGDVVIYESTVYPGATEEVCVPVIEQISGLKFNTDFYCGYSPERINPGDKNKTLTNIRKITAGSDEKSAQFVDILYNEIIEAGTVPVSSIKIAEAAKVIENVQRDINIAFVNELAKIFNLMQLDTREILDAAATKWNFLPFTPGLVGGHCIGVDPFYIAHKAKELGYHPEIILAGRRVNDSMGRYVAAQFIKLLINEGRPVKGANILVLGITFKENCPDIRNSRVVDIIDELRSFGANVSVYDPWADAEEVLNEYKISLLTSLPRIDGYTGVIAAVAHEQFFDIDLGDEAIVYDVKGIFARGKVSGRL